MLFDAKLAEAKQQFVYVRGELQRLRVSAHHNLQARIDLELDLIEGWLSDLEYFQEELRLYQVARRPSIDIWRQLFKMMKELCFMAHLLRIQELPASLVHSSNNHWMSNVLEVIHKEVGLAHIHPIASLHQMEWFSVLSMFPEHPIYVMPDVSEGDVTEIALIYHEIGHTIFGVFEADFPRQIEQTLTDTFRRKFREATEEADPNDFDSKTEAVRAWQSQVQDEMEETVCDIVGTLLGGPAFAAALSLGLLTLSENPFAKDTNLYPPLDIRIRITEAVLRHRGVHASILDHIHDTWQRIIPLYQLEHERWYSWLYDEKYLNDLIRTVENYLLNKGVNLYEPEELTLRGQINVGVALKLDDSANYQGWLTTFTTALQSLKP